MTTTPEVQAQEGEALDATRAPYGRSPSVRPALIVLACAAVVSIGSFGLSLIGSGSPAATVSGLGKPVPGVNLLAVDAATVLKRITTDGVPPKNIVDSLVVPKGALVISTSTQDAGIDQYDRSVYLQIDAPSKEILRFYGVELKRADWSGAGKVYDDKEVIGEKAGTDGYDWEVGVVVTPVSPGAISPSLAGGSQTSPTAGIRLRLFQIADDGP